MTSTVRGSAPEGVVFRQATAADMSGISHVRFSVVENASTPERLAQRGITNDSVAASFLGSSKGWVAEQADQIVGFSIADKESRAIFALFVLPAFQGCGIGSRLFDLALAWLWENGAQRAWLATGAGTEASRFYERRGWVANGADEYGDIRYEYGRPTQG